MYIAPGDVNIIQKPVVGWRLGGIKYGLVKDKNTYLNLISTLPMTVCEINYIEARGNRLLECKTEFQLHFPCNDMKGLSITTMLCLDFR